MAVLMASVLAGIWAMSVVIALALSWAAAPLTLARTGMAVAWATFAAIALCAMAQGFFTLTI